MFKWFTIVVSINFIGPLLSDNSHPSHPNLNNGCIKNNNISPDWYSLENNRSYKYYSFKQNWFNALWVCHHEGGYLAIPNSEKEAKRITERVSNDAWIGVHQLYEDNKFITFDGDSIEKPAYTWFKWKPKDQNFKCVLMHKDNKGSISIEKHSCRDEHHFFCEKRSCEYSTDRCDSSSVENDSAKCPGSLKEQIVPEGFTWMAGNNYHKFFQKEKTWKDAWKICHDLGGYLAIPRTKEEAEALMAHMKNSDYSGDVKAVWIGVHRPNATQIWFTVRGVPWEKTALPRWAPLKSLEPEYGGEILDTFVDVNYIAGLKPESHTTNGRCSHGQECCATLHYQNAFYYKLCELKRAFFCELPPFKYSAQ